jgi:hypothetical protein
MIDFNRNADFARIEIPLVINTGRRLDILNVLAQSVGMDGPILQADGTILIHPGEGVFHPVLVIPLGEIFAGVSAAALGAGDGGLHQSRRLKTGSVKQYADSLREEMDRRRLGYTPIMWP